MAGARPQRVGVFGATGSIGASTLDVLARHPDLFEVVALSANTNVKAMAVLCEQFEPLIAVMGDADAAVSLAKRLPRESKTQVLAGAQGLIDAACHDLVDTLVAGIVGAAGLPSCLAAVKAGKRVLIANKEALVIAGEIVMAAAAESGATVLPIDSEHNGLFQCLPQRPDKNPANDGVERLILTASGGPFRNRDQRSFAAVTVAEAVAHPNWDMGQKISVDSATMMNKGLEVIEAARFFQMPATKIDVLIHPQSIVHALVQYRDGSVLAQMGQPDMRTPIANALAWPQRIDSGVAPLNLAVVGQLEFSAPDPLRFPCLPLAIQALNAGAAATAILNAANEVAVSAFLAEQLRFDYIAGVIEETLATLSAEHGSSLEALMEIDQLARQQAAAAVARWRN